MLLDYETVAYCSRSTHPEKRLYMRVSRQIPSCEISPAVLHNSKLPGICKSKGARRSKHTLQNTPDA